MSRETINPDYIEVVPPSTADLYESSKKKMLVKAGAVLGALSLAASLSPLRGELAQANSKAAKTTHALEYVGPTSDQVWVPSLAEAQQAAQEIAETGATTVRFFEPYSPGQAEINNDRQRLCNAVEAAHEKNLIPVISFMGHNGDKVNFVPSNASAVTKFTTTIGTILWSIAGPNANKSGSNGSPACVQEPIKQVIIEEGNEVNSNTFNANQDSAQKYAYLTARTETAINNDVAAINRALEASSDPNIRATLTVKKAIGGLAAGRNDPVGFLKQYDSALKQLGINHFPGDMLTVHPYPTDSTTDPAIVEANLYPALEGELKNAYGKDISIFYDEEGTGAIQDSKKPLYGPQSRAAAVVSTGQQAQYYRDAIIEAASELDVVGALTFQSRDESNDGWPTGYYNVDGSRKISTWNAISIANQAAKDGTFNNSP